MGTLISVQLPVTVLIADDDITLRMVLRHLLEGEGYTVEEAQDGVQAEAMIQQVHPDLILLDAVMPNKDGFEVCAHLRTLPGYEHIPVLIMTGLDDDESIDHAFEFGAVDFVPKPMQWAVLRQRVRRLIAAQQLEKMRDNLIQMIVHDMKNPIATIRGFAELLLSEPETYDPTTLDCLKRIFHSSNNLLDMTTMILDIGRLEEGKLTLQRVSQPVCPILEEVKDSFVWMASNYQVNLEIGACDRDLEFALDWGIMRRVLANLISNAIKHSPQNATVALAGTFVDGAEPALRLAVTDHGEGIPEQDRSRIFEKFSKASRRKRGSRSDTGLGLTFCKLATEAHGGRIELESAIDVGSTFTLVFPQVRA